MAKMAFEKDKAEGDIEKGQSIDERPYFEIMNNAGVILEAFSRG